MTPIVEIETLSVKGQLPNDQSKLVSLDGELIYNGTTLKLRELVKQQKVFLNTMQECRGNDFTKQYFVVYNLTKYEVSHGLYAVIDYELKQIQARKKRQQHNQKQAYIVALDYQGNELASTPLFRNAAGQLCVVGKLIDEELNIVRG